MRLGVVFVPVIVVLVALGAQLAKPDATVITVTGDGSIMMNIQELATLDHEDDIVLTEKPA